MTDCVFLLGVLSDGEPHSLNEILRRSFMERGCGLTVHSRVADLRKRGHVIHWRHDAKARRGDASIYTLTSLPPAPVSPPLPEDVVESALEGARAASNQPGSLAGMAPPELEGQLSLT